MVFKHVRYYRVVISFLQFLNYQYFLTLTLDLDIHGLDGFKANLGEFGSTGTLSNWICLKSNPIWVIHMDRSKIAHPGVEFTIHFTSALMIFTLFRSLMPLLPRHALNPEGFRHLWLCLLGRWDCQTRPQQWRSQQKTYRYG
jgi:hypothetical protein